MSVKENIVKREPSDFHNRTVFAIIAIIAGILIKTDILFRKSIVLRINIDAPYLHAIYRNSTFRIRILL